MSKQLTSVVDIAAGPDQVWQVLTDFEAYPRWNPFIVRADGTPEVGSRLTLRMQPVGSGAMTLKPTVLEATPGRRLNWLGRLGIAGILDAEHSVSLEAIGDGGTRVRQTERFRGVLVPFVAGSLDRHTLPAFEGMNEALRHQVEHDVTARRG